MIIVSDFSIPNTDRAGMFFVLFIAILDWSLSKSNQDTIFNLKFSKSKKLNSLLSYFRYLIFIIIILLTLFLRGTEQKFIYFQF